MAIRRRVGRIAGGWLFHRDRAAAAGRPARDQGAVSELFDVLPVALLRAIRPGQAGATEDRIKPDADAQGAGAPRPIVLAA